MKLNLGSGTDLLDGYVNHDIAKLPGIDIVHNLNSTPWPWDSSAIDEIKIYDVLEHLDDFMSAMEEIWRILIPGGICRLRVPYWNSWCAYADPTHKRSFHELTFDFFDPRSPYCQQRHYYTHARFLIKEISFVICPFSPYFSIPGLREIKISNPIARRLLGLIGGFISNLILDIEVVLIKAP
jgi:SAM-dependent methyltransferase